MNIENGTGAYDLAVMDSSSATGPVLDRWVPINGTLGTTTQLVLQGLPYPALLNLRLLASGPMPSMAGTNLANDSAIATIAPIATTQVLSSVPEQFPGLSATDSYSLLGTAGNAREPRILTTSEGLVVVGWVDDSGLHVTASKDGGRSFAPPEVVASDVSVVGDPWTWTTGPGRNISIFAKVNATPSGGQGEVEYITFDPATKAVSGGRPLEVGMTYIGPIAARSTSTGVVYFAGEGPAAVGNGPRAEIDVWTVSANGNPSEISRFPTRDAAPGSTLAVSSVGAVALAFTPSSCEECPALQNATIEIAVSNASNRTMGPLVAVPALASAALLGASQLNLGSFQFTSITNGTVQLVDDVGGAITLRNLGEAPQANGIAGALDVETGGSWVAWSTNVASPMIQWLPASSTEPPVPYASAEKVVDANGSAVGFVQGMATLPDGTPVVLSQSDTGTLAVTPILDATPPVGSGLTLQYPPAGGANLIAGGPVAPPFSISLEGGSSVLLEADSAGIISVAVSNHQSQAASLSIAFDSPDGLDISQGIVITVPAGAVAVAHIPYRTESFVDPRGSLEVLAATYGTGQRAPILTPVSSLPYQVAAPTPPSSPFNVVGWAEFGSALVFFCLIALFTAAQLGVQFASAPFQALYSRTPKTDLLRHEIRAAIHELVTGVPGLRFEQIRHELGLSIGSLAYHLQTLEREGYVRKVTDWARPRYYPTGSTSAIPESAPASARIETALQGSEPLLIGQIAKKIGVSRQLARYHLRPLIEAGKVVQIPGGVQPKYALRPGPVRMPNDGERE
ncbi:MAG: helix-turn-helix domain-containing protein [Thermoplasmatota archaeon]